MLSATWQVPVLYFAPMWTESLEPLTLKEVYTFIVEKSSKEALEDVGILGGISHGVVLEARLFNCLGSPTIGNTVLLHSSLSDGGVIERYPRRQQGNFTRYVTATMARTGRRNSQYPRPSINFIEIQSIS